MKQDRKTTHVLIPPEVRARLKDLATKLRIPQSILLDEAVGDLLGKYGRAPKDQTSESKAEHEEAGT